MQGVGLVHGVPEGGTVWEVPFARSTHAREARFFGELMIKREGGPSLLDAVLSDPKVWPLTQFFSRFLFRKSYIFLEGGNQGLFHLHLAVDSRATENQNWHKP